MEDPEADRGSASAIPNKIKSGQVEDDESNKREKFRMVINELTDQKKKLTQQIKEEEKERDAKRKAFEDEERRWMKHMSEEKRLSENARQQSLSECKCYEERATALRRSLESQEDKLEALKMQYETFQEKMEQAQTKNDSDLKVKIVRGGVN